MRLRPCVFPAFKPDHADFSGMFSTHYGVWIDFEFPYAPLLADCAWNSERHFFHRAGVFGPTISIMNASLNGFGKVEAAAADRLR
jgi:hypothetical protein